jgi:hypothetical protein
VAAFREKIGTINERGNLVLSECRVGLLGEVKDGKRGFLGWNLKKTMSQNVHIPPCHFFSFVFPQSRESKRDGAE